MNVIVDGEQSTICALKEYDTNFLSASPINITADGTSDATTLSISFKQSGTPSITLEFCKAGKTVDTITFNFNVIGDTAISSEEENTASGTSAPTAQSISQSATQTTQSGTISSQTNPAQSKTGSSQSAGIIQSTAPPQQKTPVTQQATQSTSGAITSGNKTTSSNPLPVDTAPPVEQSATPSSSGPNYSTAVQPEGTGVKNVNP